MGTNIKSTIEEKLGTEEQKGITETIIIVEMRMVTEERVENDLDIEKVAIGLVRTEMRKEDGYIAPVNKI